MITVPHTSPYVSSHSDASYIEKKTVTDLYQQMKDQSTHHPPPTRSLSSAANLTSLCVDISPSSSNFFEVLYIGKIKVWNRKVPDTFIDDALERFKIHEQEKSKKLLDRVKSQDSIRRGSQDSTTSEGSSLDGSKPQPTSEKEEPPKELKSTQSSYTLSNQTQSETLVTKSSSLQNIPGTSENEAQKQQCVDMDDHNRTMVLQVDRTDLRLISPDRKVILMHKQNREVTTCIQGVTNSEHFGFICKESQNLNTFIGYVFKCESASVAGDAVQAITQAFNNAESRTVRPTITSCEHCPMVWYHKLCAEIEHLSDRKTQAVIFRKIDQLEEEEQNTILTKFKGAETDSIREQNEFLMMLLRAHCEMKQGRHVHDTAENRSEFLNQYLGGSTIFMKAKRSLTNSFDHLLKRKASKDDFNPILRDMTLPIQTANRESSPFSPSNADTSDKESEGTRSRTSTIGSQSDLRDAHLSVGENPQKGSVSPDHVNGSEKGLKSPMMDIFLKVGSSPKSVASEEGSPKMDGGSWRQAIFKQVVTPSKPLEEERPKKKSRVELRELWKKSINQVILLARMDKENARLKAKQEENAVKRIKLEYDEMKLNQREVMDVWDMVTNKESRVKCDNQMLLHAIRQGVPRSKRGDVWLFLAEQYCSRMPPVDTNKYPNYNVPYETWLKQLTSHQHAILIDLGRTFPSHSYYSSPMGPGQLALFNLLKAYSLLDPEVGYCQGLSFVAGVLLLHVEESQAFFLLRHLMFRRGLRKQYLPDMVGLQIKLYQLSRLLRDRLPELYEHFDFYEVAPTLYAAPWLLTIFASQFPLGFVTRVFDLIFLENTDVIFRVALALLTYHKDKLLACDGFEEIMNYLKTKVPAFDKVTLDKIMKQVFTTDISKQLNEYKVEYQVIQEEMIAVQPQMDALHKMEAQNKTLTEQNKALMAQLELALSNVQRLEKTRTIQQSTINKLEMQNRTYEVTIATLGSFINNLMDERKDIEMPGEVRRIISQITVSEKRKNQNNLMKMFSTENSRCSPEKLMVKSLSTGKITLPNPEGMVRSNSLNTQGQTPTQKVSNFFSSSHSDILQKRQSMQNVLSNAKIDIKIQEFDLNDKSISLPLEGKASPDSGIGTPMSPKEAHPLSNCDVNFTYNGTRELKTIKSIKNLSRNSSPDMMRK